MTDDATYRRAVERCSALERERDALTQQAQIWKQEAETQKATVHECYQVCTGATGEPGDWNGANPVREVVAQRDLALAECERLRADLRDTFAGIALGAMIGNTDKDGHTRGKKGVPVLANYSYEYADAMLAARAKP